MLGRGKRQWLPGRFGTVLQHIRKLAVSEAAEGATDCQLLERYSIQRDQTAFSALLVRHGALVWNVCRHVLDNEHDAEDAFQAAFLVLARKAPSIRQVGSWLHKVAYLSAMELKRKAARRRHHEKQAAVSTQPKPQGDLAWRELLAVLDAEVQRLPKHFREAFVLCCLEGRSKAEAARELGWPEGTVSGRLAQARKRLQQRLTRQGITLSAGLTATALATNARAPAALVEGAVRQALLFAAREAAGMVRSVALAEAVLKGMAATKVKASLLVALVATVVATGIGLAAYQRLPQKQPTPAPENSPRLVTKADDHLRRAEEKRAGTDVYGDPLPEGALARLGTVRFRHAGWNSTLAFSPDGTIVAGAGHDWVRLWNSTSGWPIRVFNGRADALMFLEEGKRIAAVGDDLAVFDVASGREISRLSIKGGLHQAAYSPDGKLLAGTATDGSLRLLDANTGQVLKQLAGHEDQLNQRPALIAEVGSVSFSPDSQRLASACFLDSRIFIWDTTTGKALHKLPGHQRPHVVAFSPDGRTLAVGGDDRIIRLWDTGTGRYLQQLRGHVGGIRGLVFSADGSALASAASGIPPDALDGASLDSTVRLWDLKTGKGRPLPGPEQWARTVAFSPDGKTLAAGGSGTAVQMIDVASGKAKHPPIGHDGGIFRVALSPDGSTLASGGRDNLIHLWDLKTSKEKARLKGHQGHVSGLAYTPDGYELVSCSYDGTVRVWNWKNGKESRGFAKTGGWHYGFDLASDGKTLLLPTGQLWDVSTGKQTGVIPKYEGLQCRAVFSPDGKRLAAAPTWAVAVVLDVATGKEICRFTGHEAWKDQGGRSEIMIDCVAFSPDGRQVASGGREGLAFVWDAETGKMQRRLQGHASPIIAVAFSPDGRVLATGSGDAFNHREQTVRLWEIATGKERRRFSGHQAQVTSIVFTADARKIISGSEDGTALVWDAAGVLKGQVLKEDGKTLWQTLASEDAIAAYEAICALTAQGDVALLESTLRPVQAPAPAQIERLVENLDSKEFTTRKRADDALSQLEELAAPALRKAITKNPPPELRRRAEALLAKLETSLPSAKTVQGLRAVEVLERIGTQEAQRVLKRLAVGAPEARLTQEASVALDRLAKAARRP